jgi:hypothetical protein
MILKERHHHRFTLFHFLILAMYFDCSDTRDRFHAILDMLYANLNADIPKVLIQDYRSDPHILFQMPSKLKIEERGKSSIPLGDQKSKGQ